MDCRKYLVAALTLLGGVAGCSSRQPTPPPSAKVQTAAAKPSIEENLPKKTPKAATCVAYGVFSEREAAATQLNPVEREKKLDMARRAYEQAVSIDPSSLPAIQGLARVHLQLGDQERAISVYRQALKKLPKEASLWYDLGMCHAKRKEWMPAAQSMQTALDLDPGNRDIAKTLGFTLARAGRIDESVACLSKVLGPAQAHLNVARMLHHLNQNDLSRQHMHLALQADPNLARAPEGQELLTALQGQTGGVMRTGYQEQK
jgi:tetratricopeptide (TPR) repeat protein